jgi:hypothetical protein
LIKTVTTEILDSDLEAYAEGSTDERAKIVQDIFEHLDDGDLGELLGYFCTGDREAYNEDPYVIGVDMHDDTSGTISVDFTGSAYYGCKDMDRLDEHSESVIFEVSPGDALVKFTTEPPDPVDRPPDDEF